MSHVLGIDIACESFVAHLVQDQPDPVPVDEDPLFDNTTAGFRRCAAWLQSHGTTPDATLLVVEATGVYWEALAWFFTEHGFPISVVNPAQIKYFSRSVLQRGKSDRLDAGVIALFGVRMRPRRWMPPSPISEELQVLMRQRDAYVGMLNQERSRLHAFQHAAHTPASAITVCEQTIAFLRKQIRELDDGFKDTLGGDPRWAHLYELLRTIPSIGPVTAGVFLTETRALNAFVSARQLTAYAGIAPVPYSSGSSTHHKPRISKIGDARLRKAFYMAAVSAVRSNPQMHRVYERLLERGKPKKLILIALARKLLVMCFAICQSDRPYCTDYCPAR
jgi:transposase